VKDFMQRRFGFPEVPQWRLINEIPLPTTEGPIDPAFLDIPVSEGRRPNARCISTGGS
jgi:hypothetical protein